MNPQIYFDHIEVHVEDVSKYCLFLEKMFQGGRYKIISDTGTSMFKTLDGINIEIKKRKTAESPSASGFCNPCLRMENAGGFISNTLGYEIIKTVKNPDGNCHFFIDYEGITWHIKDYLVQDMYINW